MVSSVTNFGRNGLVDWLVQRVTAVIIGVYALVVMGCVLCHPMTTYAAWQALFSCTFVKVFGLLSLLSLCAHAWIGLWTVFTDYIKCAKLRVLLEVILIVILVTYVIWGISIFWR